MNISEKAVRAFFKEVIFLVIIISFIALLFKFNDQSKQIKDLNDKLTITNEVLSDTVDRLDKLNRN